jgi:Domain of unknown function (DUF4177)
MVKYEYKTVPVHTIRERYGLSVDKLNEFGEEGWQLVVVINGTAVFKRKKRLIKYVD